MTTELPADVIGRAAKLMRKRAEEAGSAPWRTAGADSCQCCLMIRDATGSLICTADDRQAPHIAGWHPLVAQAVADWLDKIAWMLTLDDDLAGRTGCDEALVVARAYLGEEAPS